MNRNKQTETKGQVEKIHSKLDEIYEWFLANLKAPETKSNKLSSTPEDSAQPSGSSPIIDNDGLFSVYYQKHPGESIRDSTIICPRASLDLSLAGDAIASGLPNLGSIFSCHCRSSSQQGSNDIGDHKERLQFTRMFPFSYSSASTNWSQYYLIASSFASSATRANIIGIYTLLHLYTALLYRCY